MSFLNFDNRVAVVTGAGRGLGRTYALELACRGARVIVNDIDASEADGVVDEIDQAGGAAIAVVCSVDEEANGQRIAKTAVDAFGRLDIVINNAGFSLARAFEDLSLEAFRSVVDTHLMGSASITMGAWPIMQAQGYGRVVMTASSAGFWGIAQTSGYCSGKAGVFGLMKGLSQEGKACGIRVNAIAPGAKTRMTSRLFEGGRGERTWRPELVTPAVIYMASEACRHNGATFAALAGHFACIDVVQSPGFQFDPRGEVSAEDFIGKLETIEDMDGASPLSDGLAPEILTTGR